MWHHRRRRTVLALSLVASPQTQAFVAHSTPPTAGVSCRAATCVALSSDDAYAFPEGYDPNYEGFKSFDSRTWSGAIAQREAAPVEPWLAEPSTAATQKITDLEALLQSFDFDASTDDEVAKCQQIIFAQLRREATELSGSRLTAGLVRRCVLSQNSLQEAVATMLSGKVRSEISMARWRRWWLRSNGQDHGGGGGGGSGGAGAGGGAGGGSCHRPGGSDGMWW